MSSKDYEENYEEEDYSLDEDNQSLEDEGEDDSYVSNIQMAGDIQNQSDTIKKFPHLVKDVKYAFHDNFDKKAFVHKASTYQMLGYVQKVERIAEMELEECKKARISLYECESEEDLKDYYNSIGKSYIYQRLKNSNLESDSQDPEFLLPSKLEKIKSLFKVKKKQQESNFEQVSETQIQKLLNEIKNNRENDIAKNVYNSNINFFGDAYDSYLGQNNVDNVIDDFGLMSDMMTRTEASKAYMGQERKAAISTISVTKGENEQENYEEEPAPSESYGSSGKSGWKKLLKR